jgi:hypothetical protein
VDGLHAGVLRRPGAPLEASGRLRCGTRRRPACRRPAPAGRRPRRRRR